MTFLSKEQRRGLQTVAARIQVTLDSEPALPEPALDLHTVQVTGSKMTMYDVLKVLVAHVGMRNILRALLEIQKGE